MTSVWFKSVTVPSPVLIYGRVNGEAPHTLTMGLLIPGVWWLFLKDIYITHIYIIKQQLADDNGRLLILEMEIGGTNFMIGSIYAPTSDRQEEHNSFMDVLEEKLGMLDTSNLILGGTSTSL